MKSTSEGGEIVQVEGGHILRSTARKDRHSKVYTSKGPRDRRVRLSAHTAIQFYDVQDRLGYDRPSKAVDWLINKAKTAIDKLNEASPSSGPGQFSLLHPIHNPPGFNTAPSDLNLLKSLLNNDDSVSRMSQDLGLSLHPFQESFDGWNVNSAGNSAAPSVFSHLELLQSNPWQTNPQAYAAKTLDLQSAFELGFRVPACIYGDEEPQNHEDRH